MGRLDEKYKLLGNFEKFEKILKKVPKMHYFSICVNKNFVTFLRVWTKNTNSWETLRNLSKNSLRKYQKCITLADFQQNFKSSALIFCAFGRKTQIVGNFKNF